MKRLIIITSFFILTSALAQTNVSLRYFGLTIHPSGDQTASLQPYKLDKRAICVANFGGFLSVDHYVFYDQFAFSVMQGLFTDCSGGAAGFTHVGVKGLFFDIGRSRLMIDIGPMLYYRRDWNRFPEYNDGGVFHRYHSPDFGDIQYRIFPVGFEFCYNYVVNENLDLNAGFTPGLPFALTFSVGATYWPERFKVKFQQPKVHFHRKNQGAE